SQVSAAGGAHSDDSLGTGDHVSSAGAAVAGAGARRWRDPRRYMTRTDPTPPAGEATARRHISVCICTYKRPQLLAQLLGALDVQRTEDRFTYSVVVADNDHGESARPVVGEFAGRASITVSYCVEPRQNIALARNRAVDNASGDFIAFIDDDEEPVADWLLHLHGTVIAYGADGAIGPGV